jgi:hypothetical protein
MLGATTIPLAFRSIGATSHSGITTRQSPAELPVNWPRPCARFPALRYAHAMRNPMRLFVMLGVLGVLVLAAVAIRASFAPARRAPSAAADVTEPSGDVVSQALDLAKPDSLRIKTAWVDEVPDLELAALVPRARDTYLRIANGRMCDCGCGYTLAGCRRYDTTCPVSGPRARALFDSVRTGRITSAEAYPERPIAM